MRATSKASWCRAAVSALLLAAGILSVPSVAQAQSARALYERAQSREQALRKTRAPSPDALRSAARAYENVVRRYPTSGYCDNALWQAAGLMVTVYDATGRAADRDLAERYLDWLRNEYPHSSLVRQVDARRRELTPRRPAPAPTPATTSAPASPPLAEGTALVRRITRMALPRGDRVVIELSHEVAYRGDRVEDPDRVFFDFQSSAPAADLINLAEDVDGRLLEALRIGRHENQVTRVVLQLNGNPRYSAFPLYNPFRLVVDVESEALEPLPATTVPAMTDIVAAAPESGPVPVPPAATSKGDYSLARQLGLGVSRIVIDAGHGGHDPGAKANGLTESELVLDIARRVQKILSEKPGFEVILTRQGNDFIPLEERTAIANREGADLFLSIHANASRRKATRGVETYVLNFATNPEAEEVAARENASSSQTMGTLPAILNAIALNNKLAESRELATIVQTSLVRRLRAQDSGVRDLGVKQAPFVVLIGAQMPSVLAEISFITHSAEATLLKTSSYRDRIAQALAEAIVKYQASLKKVTTLASQ